MSEGRLLILTDHGKHSAENSLYALVQAMVKSEAFADIKVATRADPNNADFFEGKAVDTLHAVDGTTDFEFDKGGSAFQNTVSIDPQNYDATWLRMPPPMSFAFADFLKINFSGSYIFNNPQGIIETSTKAFLTHFPQICPPMQLCRSMDDIIAFKKNFAIVLKPLRDYGGQGIVRIDGDRVWDGHTEKAFDAFVEEKSESKFDYLAVRYLKNVSKGDKRILVVDGHIIGATLRLPKADSWLCNMAMGGTTHDTEIEDEERAIIKLIDPVLSEKGIVMYGVDTLVNDDGRRVLSEVNTTSSGGFKHLTQLYGEELLERTTDLLIKRIHKETSKT